MVTKPLDRRAMIKAAAFSSLGLVGRVGTTAERKLQAGEANFAASRESEVPERFRLPAAKFGYEMRELPIGSDSIEIWDVTFPSPITTPHPANNTVHAEYYRPKSAKPAPAVIVLHILGGDFPLARLFANDFAQHGIAALFVKMPYYGPRRDPDSPRRMVSHDPHQTVEGMTQAICDIRRATAWLAARDEVNAEKIGVFGISLGGITGALALGAEPQLTRGCLLLAGGDIGKVAWESKEVAKARNQWLATGGTQEEFMKTLVPIDPVTYAQRARGKQILMLNAASDEVIPKACTESLWQAFGKPRIEWFPGGHYSVILHLPRALVRAAKFLAEA